MYPGHGGFLCAGVIGQKRNSLVARLMICACNCASSCIPIVLFAKGWPIHMRFLFASEQYVPIIIEFSSTQPSALNVQGPWVSVIELPGGVIHDNDFPISVFGVCMASKNFIDG